MGTPIVPLTPAADAGKENKSASDAKATPATAAGSDGGTTFDAEILEGEILAYAGLERIARMIALEIRDAVHGLEPVHPEPKEKRYRFFVLDGDGKRAMARHQAFLMQTAHLVEIFQLVKERLDELLHPLEARVESLTAVVAAITSVANLAGIFREDITYKSRKYTAHMEGFENSLARSLLRVIPKSEVRNPRQLLYRPGRDAQLSHRGLLARIQEVEEARFEAERLANEAAVRVLRLQFQIEPPKPAPAPTGAPLEALVRELAKLKGPLQAANAILTEAQARWAAIQKRLDETVEGKESLLSEIQRGEEILASAGPNRESAFFLIVDIISLRANFRSAKGTLVNLGGKDSLSYSGGAIATYSLLNSEAAIVGAGTHRYRSPYQRFKKKEEPDDNDGNSFNERFQALD